MISFQDEAYKALAQRALKFVLVLALHGGWAAAVLHGLHVSHMQDHVYPPVHLDVPVISVSLLALPHPAAQIMSPLPAELPTKLPRPTTHIPASPPAETSILRPVLTAQHAAFTAASAMPIVPMRAAQQAEANVAAPAVQPASITTKPAALIAAHVDANYLQKPLPPYPMLSRKYNEEGKVLLLVKVNAQGAVEGIQVQHSSGFPRLDEVALYTVRQWRFVAARRGEEAMADSVVVPMVFQLND